MAQSGNMVAEVTLHNDIEMNKKCPKIAKKMPKLSKIAQNCTKLPKIERLPQELYFPHCDSGEIHHSIMEIR